MRPRADLAAQPIELATVLTGLTALLTGLAALLLGAPSLAEELALVQGSIVGEVSHESALLQTRLTAADRPPGGDPSGRPGVVHFEISQTPDFAEVVRLPLQRASAEGDFIVRSFVEGLQPDTRYYHRAAFGSDEASLGYGAAGSFRSLPGPERAAPLRFVVLSCMNYAAFHEGKGRWWGRRGPYEGPDRERGYPALDAIRALAPDFVVANGDNVYYDHGDDPATDRASMRRHWHRQLAQPRFVALFAETATYWTKDDHDFRFNDADGTGGAPPSPELGIAVFREQVPVVEAGSHAPSFRTRRVSRDLQLWLLEGRDHRSPNAMPDGPEKSLWGAVQREWLRRTLEDSVATFKIVVTPTPLVGPDDLWKRDNHTNALGFRHEGQAFLAWAGEHVPGLLLVTGDRHWQYHSIHPSGIEELSSGALHDENARLGRAPGDWLSTDWSGEIRQPYTASETTGGFLSVELTPAEAGARARLVLRFHDDTGRVRHEVER